MHGFAELMRSLDHLQPQEHAKIVKAFEFANDAHATQMRKSGEPYITHPVAVAQILAELHADADAIVAGLLHDTVEDTDVTFVDIEREFGSSVRRIVEGETKLSKLTKFSNLHDAQAENLRQMLIAMMNDQRVLVVKLADRLHNMRTLGFYSSTDKQKRISKETIEIFAPLAHRFGIGQIKTELEDLSFQYLYPEEYENLCKQLENKTIERQKHITDAIGQLRNLLESDEELKRWILSYELSGRSKHLWSIHQKMVRDNKSIDQIFDLLAIRLILKPKPIQDKEIVIQHQDNETPEDCKDKLEIAREEMTNIREKRVCYQTLGAVHAMWTPIPGRFKDYIAISKPNGYQSLHTTVISFEGQPIEVQIRTDRMHEVAEYGIAAHWQYKSRHHQTQAARKNQWINQLDSLRQEIPDASDFVDAVKEDLLSSRVFVFTPKGDTYHLPRGATPIDFAYHVHTRIGETCNGARVNGSIVPLNYELNNGDRVEIITSKQSNGPSKDWLKYAITRSAKVKIRHYFRALERQEALAHGHEMLERHLRDQNLPVRQLMRTKNLEEVSEKLVNSLNPDDLYLALNSNRMPLSQVIQLLSPPKVIPEETTLPSSVVSKRKSGKQNNSGIFIDGIDIGNINIGNCCNPIQGDEIWGYITRGRGVTVHRRDCHNMQRLLRDEKARCKEAYWKTEKPGYQDVNLDVICLDRPGLLKDILEVLVVQKRNASRVEAGKSAAGIAHVYLRVMVRDNHDLNWLAQSIAEVQDVREVLRVGTKRSSKLIV